MRSCLFFVSISNYTCISWSTIDEKTLIYRSQDRGRRRGYMGHLTKMANDIVAVMEKGENSDLVKDQIAG